MEIDLVVANGSVVDGTGSPPFDADVGIRAGRIVAVARERRLEGARVLDAGGMVVAPGFVDVDSHADWALLSRDARPLLGRWLRQGVTTVIGGACGFAPAPVLDGMAGIVASHSAFLRELPFVPTWRTFGEFLDTVARRALPINVGFLVGQNLLRAQALASGAVPETQAIGVVVEQAVDALRAGALGVSANVGFVPGVLAPDEELRALAQAVAREDRLLAVHARAYTRMSPAYRPFPAREPHNLRAVRELADISHDSGARLHVLHLMTVGRRSWRTCTGLLRLVDHSRAAGADLGFDAAPYTVAVGPIQLLFPPAVASTSAGRRPRAHVWELRLLSRAQRLLLGMGAADVRLVSAPGDPSLRELEGCSFAEIARRLRMSAAEAQLEVATRTGMNGASVAIGTVSGEPGDERPLEAILAHPHCAIGTNAASKSSGWQNPSVTGAFPRVLGHLVRERRLLSLEEAVRRMTSLPASRLGLTEIGRVAEGCRADLTVFDPARVRDPANPEDANAVPEGIRTVIVSGIPVLLDGLAVPGAAPGRVLRRNDPRER